MVALHEQMDSLAESLRQQEFGDGGSGTGDQATVFFGSEANAARPINAQPVIWVGYAGTVPENALDDFDVIIAFEAAAPPGPEPPASAPTLSVAAFSDTRIDGTIGALGDATGYEWTYEAGIQVGDPTTGTPVDLAAATTFQATGLIAETTYTFWARGYNDDGAGPWSTPQTATTEATGLSYTDSFTTTPPTTDRLSSRPEWKNHIGDSWLSVITTDGGTCRNSSSTGLRTNLLDTTFQTYPDDQWVEVDWTVMSATVAGRHFLVVRGSGGTAALTAQGYYATWNQDGVWQIGKHTAGATYTVLESGSRTPVEIGTHRLEVEGTTIRYWINGTLMGTATDSDITSGQPGLGMERSDSRAGEFRSGAL